MNNYCPVCASIGNLSGMQIVAVSSFDSSWNQPYKAVCEKVAKHTIPVHTTICRSEAERRISVLK